MSSQCPTDAVGQPPTPTPTNTYRYIGIYILTYSTRGPGRGAEESLPRPTISRPVTQLVTQLKKRDAFPTAVTPICSNSLASAAGSIDV